MEKHFFIFRHGQTVWNAEGRPHGQDPYPVPLTMVGQEQVRQLADKLKDKNIELIISSDQLRAEQTSKIIAEKINVEIIYIPALREVDYGKLNGLYSLEREDVYPEYKKCYQDYSFPFPEGESFAEAAKRFQQALEETANQYPCQNIAVSTHGNVVDVFLEIIFDKKYQKVGNCEFVHISYDTDLKKFTPIDMPPDYIFYPKNS